MLASPSSSSSSSPNSASATGASMPAATCHAPGTPASSTTVRSPRWAARQAQASPTAPPPATATSYCLDCAATAIASLRRYDPDQVRRSAARCRPLSPSAGSRVCRPSLEAPRRCNAGDVTPRERLSPARLYLVCPAREPGWLRAALRGGVDIVQLRDRSLSDGEVV